MIEINERVIAILAEILTIPRDRIVLDLAVGDIPEWDSLAHTRIVIGLEQEFGLVLDVEDTMELDTVQSILDCVHERVPG